ncbi:MAG: glucose 1-dehydrogenase [Pseudomonadota bacterium]
MSEIQPLSGQVALVTGASSGIGAACAIGLAKAGAAVALNYNSDQEGAETAANACRAAGANAITLQGNVGEEADIAALFAATVDAFGAVDIAIANAGIQRDAPLASMTKADWDLVINVNLTGVFLTVRAAVNQFRAQGKRQSRALGKIIIMSSVHDVIPWAGHINYATSKGGALMLMKTAAQECAQEGIRVNAISPGAIATAINRDVWSDPAQAEALKTLIPYGRIGDPEDVANAAVWLASDASDYVNGHALVVDGGMELYPEFRDNG